MSSADGSQQQPQAIPRWFYARGKDWVSFDDEDDAKLERKFHQLGGEAGWQKLEDERKEAQDKKEKAEKDEDDSDDEDGALLRAPPSGTDKLLAILPGRKDEVAHKDEPEAPADGADEKIITKGKKIIVHRIANPDDIVEIQADPHKAESDPIVPVLEDALFSVDVAKMELYPAFWKGTLLRVVRSTWFYSSGTDGSFAPIAWNEGLAQDLDRAYVKVRPWERFQAKEEEASQTKNGRECDDDKQDKENDDDDDESLRQPLPSIKSNGTVKFDSVDSARIVSEDIKGRLLSLTGGSLVVRGWAKTQKLAEQKGGDSFLSGAWRSISLPWMDDDDDSEHEKGEKSQGTNKSMSRKERGQTMGAHRVGRREGAAKAPRHNKADQSGDIVREESSSSNSDQDQGWARLWPPSDAIFRPRYTISRLLGWTDGEAREEAARHEKDKATKSATRGSSWWNPFASAESDDDEDSDDDDDDEEVDETQEGKDRSDEPPELILALHGIGQALTDEFDAVDFTYDIEHLRSLCGKLSQTNKDLRRMSRGKRVQFIPVCWRNGLSFDHEEVDGIDNYYTLNEVNAGASIPFVRNVISKVILDVPYYLSPQKTKMVNGARSELNRVYKLWCLRNPDFEKRGGRVSIIGHSLGSALLTDLLSEQPTQVQPLKELPVEERKSNEHLLFNTRHAYLCGSPQGFFYYLNGGQLIARSGTARTREGTWPKDATHSEPRYGCLAAESVYNIYDATDPVAFSLSATADSFCASISLQPVELRSKVSEVLAQLEGPQISIAKILQMPSMKQGDKLRLTAVEPKDLRAAYEAAMKREEDEDTATTLRRKLAKETVASSLIANEETSESEHQERRAKTRDAAQDLGQTARFSEKAAKKKKGKGKDQQFDMARLQRGQARLNALNPHGRVDFVIPSDGLSEYLEMIGAHMSYWTSTAFASFILSQTFSDFTSPPPTDDNEPAGKAGLTRAQVKRRLSKSVEDQQASAATQ
ncbi:unnamed protein product [Tilletia controversa]|uniref:DDHD domain-containing protein n=1 Tax=Tilletia controversa TaxID=13291 RepID=A0A8X7MV99_9BASI|nr:hypothetical protein CF328_g2393 [Tilletia controversa]KAE8249868.1 hypothetical protein A4X06_0g3032 [Tilletia controversa]CAD6912341.1 unnamed protein product [Tilletia controversa]CAD6951129.1 unnamed protein product [Tilletia controversa]CAD6959804.1 unnamed protein product [Tilletia controversa]